MGESVARLAVTRLTLTNFRSYASVELAASGRPVVLAGPNGAGKTNLLDAISLLSPGRGLRGAKLGEHTRKGPAAQGEALWAVAASITRDGETHDIGTGLTLGPGGGERRQVRLNGAPAQSSADLGELVQMAVADARDGSPVHRRRQRTAQIPRPAGARLRCGPCAQRDALRTGDARTRAAAALTARAIRPGSMGWKAKWRKPASCWRRARADAVERLNATLAERGEAGAFPCAQLALDGEADALIAEHGEAACDAMRARLDACASATRRAAARISARI